jgi:1,4-alpha-glucan branching enzyme
MLHEHEADKVIAFERAGLVFAFNFHPQASHFGYRLEAPAGRYRMILDSDAAPYGGHGRLIPDQVHFTLVENLKGGCRSALSLYLPSRTAIVLEKTD